MTQVPPLPSLDTTQLLLARRALDSYVIALGEVCPALPREHLEMLTIAPVDALAISELLTSMDRPVTVFELGASLGGSAFVFGCHPAVNHVASIGPNPPVADAINARTRSTAAPVPGGELAVQDLAARALSRFPEVAARIELRPGHLGSPGDAEPAGTNKTVQLPAIEGETTRLVVLIEGAPTAEAVHGHLGEVFSQQPEAVVLLDDCRFSWGPFVQAGVARFLEEDPPGQPGHRFHLLADLVPSLSRSNLGLVCRAGDGEIEETLHTFVRRFSGRLDLLRLLEREDELVNLQSATAQELAAASRLVEEASPLAERLTRLEAEREELAGELAALRTVVSQVEALERERADLVRQLSKTEEAAHAAHERVLELEQSTSWRLTAPLRWASGQRRPG